MAAAGRRRPFRLLGATAACACALAGACAATASALATVTRTYTASTENIANPERGFFHQDLGCADHALDVDAMKLGRTSRRITLLRCVFYLDAFKDQPISEALIDRFEEHAEHAEDAGIKLVVRFAYTEQDDKTLPGYAEDAPLDRVLAHLGQLKAPLRDHAKVIALMELGFVGLWGEGGTSQHFGNYPALDDGQWADRKAVIGALLDILPADREVLVRTPLQKRHPFGAPATTAADHAAGNQRSRVGHFNDCFLATDTDMGTYSDDPDERTQEKQYLRADTRFVPMGGETCQVFSPRSDCTTAIAELRDFHWSYLNADYNRLVLNRWSSGGCMGQVQRSLGYRFTLVQASAGAQVEHGAKLTFRMTMRNDGWARTLNRRPIELVLRRPNSAARHVFPLGTAERWLPQLTQAAATKTRTCSITVPRTVPAATYDVLLNLPDPHPDLAGRPEYAIRLANTGPIWKPGAGLNDTLLDVVVRAGPGAAQQAVACADTAGG